MTKTALFLLACVGVLLLAVGVLVGQQMQRSKFDRYLEPRPVRDMQLLLLEANLDLIRDRIQVSDGVGVTTVAYDRKCACFLGTAMVYSELMNGPLDTVRYQLMKNAVWVRASLKSWFPELSDLRDNTPDWDFRMRFRQFKPDSTGKSSVEVVAEFLDGKVVFK
jgi:hypothetical protein